MSQTPRSRALKIVDDEHKRMVSDFRLSEIATEKAKREKEIVELDREASKLKV